MALSVNIRKKLAPSSWKFNLKQNRAPLWRCWGPPAAVNP